MSADAKDTLFIFLMGAIPSMFFKQGFACWIVICIAIYLFKSAGWRENKRNQPKTKKDFETRGYHPPAHWFDDDGNFKGVK